jgi:hypothetical protein
MLKGLQDHLILSLKAKTGLSPGVFISAAISAIAAVMMFAFLSVSGYAWLSIKFGPVFGALATAGFFLLVAVTGTLWSFMLRRRNKERAIVARAARAPQRTILADPSLVSLVGQATRSLGWQRVAPVMLVGFLAALWLQDARAARRTD